MRWKRFVFGLLLGAGILALLLRRVDPHQVWAVLRTVSWPLMVPSFGLALASMFLKGQRWATALAGGGVERPRRRLFAATVIGTAANMVLPARLGDVLRALVLRRHNAIPVTQALLASWSAQAFDVLAVAVLMLVGAAGGQALASPRVLALLSAGIVVGCATAALAARRPALLIRLAQRLPRKLGAKAAELVEHAANGLRFLGRPAVLVEVVLYTIAVWTCDTLGMWLALRAFHLGVGPTAAALLVAAIGLSFALPLTPGNVGTYQLIAVFVLGRFAVGRDAAFAFGLGLQAFSLVSTVALGWILFQREGLSLPALQAASPEPSDAQAP